MITRETQPTCDLLLSVRGTVQGVGFRPFVHRVATRLGLSGWVRHDPRGALIRVAGADDRIESFCHALRKELPPAAHILTITEQAADPALPGAGHEFTIIANDEAGDSEAAIPPDLALCVSCRAELADPANRRHRYPFISCPLCGPRYSIIDAVPYARANTTLRAFRMCAACEAEYEDPTNRRFHAEANACPRCGPRVVLVAPGGSEIARGDGAFREAARRLQAGQVLAVKGTGGYHLLVDATNETAIAALRLRKHREEKPLAVMFVNLAAAQASAYVSDLAARALCSPAAPIVLLPRREDNSLARGIAPGNPWLGACLAATPLHVLLLQEMGRPVVATSGNIADEPLCTEPDEARRRLATIADAFLDHDLPIAQPVDDSVLRLAKHGRVLLRRSRGFAPTPLILPGRLAGSWLCVGAQSKNTVAVGAGNRVVLSPHIGDLGGSATFGVFRKTVEMLGALHGGEFTSVACDKNPDYASTRFAESLRLPRVAVQHHLAHTLACLLEHQRAADDVLGVVWDGTGWGEAGGIWGGEFLLLRKNRALRFGRLRPFRLPGGLPATRDARRVALSLLHATGREDWENAAVAFGFTEQETAVLREMLERGTSSPLASSAGRLFDGVGALLGLGQRNRFEGQVPLAVEAAATAASGSADWSGLVRAVDLPAQAGATCELDWTPLLDAIVTQRDQRVDPSVLAASFHHALAGGIRAMARRAGAGTVVLSGGCFQNALLLDLTVEALRQEKLVVLTHRELPPNDGNIAAGQALAALWNLTSVDLP